MQAIIVCKVEPQFNKPLFNEVPDITNDILYPGQSYSKIYGIEPQYNKPWYNEFFDITNIIRKPKHKIYLDITNYNVSLFTKTIFCMTSMLQHFQIATLKVSFFCKQKVCICSKVEIIDTESHHA